MTSNSFVSILHIMKGKRCIKQSEMAVERHYFKYILRDDSIIQNVTAQWASL